MYFNPRSPCGERLANASCMAHDRIISIHAPRAGSDERECGCTDMYGNFNPRSPCGERRVSPNKKHGDLQISIHAPRAGSDQGMPVSGMTQKDFNPRSPCGERHPLSVNSKSVKRFQSTLPVRGATRKLLISWVNWFISIHAPRAGSDSRQRLPSV